MRLGAFIKQNKEEIAKEWVEYAQENIKAADKMSLKQIRDHVMEMLEAIAEDMDSPQSASEQETKSKGKKAFKATEDLAARDHGEQRVEEGFDIVQLSSEFRALRASVLRLWEKKNPQSSNGNNLQDMIRFNEAVDEAWMHSVERYHIKTDESKNWFMGILGHDLRTPLTAISGVQQLLRISPNLSEKEKALLRRTDASTKHMKELIDNLLELTNLRLGTGMTIEKTSTDLTTLCEQIIQEFQVSYPDADFRFESPGPLEGNWDPLRLRQAINNLTANALRHGKPGGPVTVQLSSQGNETFLAINNQGPPIPDTLKKMIFNRMFTQKNGERKREDSYGLGLYIVREIIENHNGKIDVESTSEKGTTFTICLPRN